MYTERLFNFDGKKHYHAFRERGIEVMTFTKKIGPPYEKPVTPKSKGMMTGFIDNREI